MSESADTMYEELNATIAELRMALGDSNSEVDRLKDELNNLKSFYNVSVPALRSQLESMTSKYVKVLEKLIERDDRDF